MDGKPARRSRKLVAAKLRRLRLQHGLSQEQLANKADVDPKTVKRAEGGEPVDFSTIKALADILGVVPADLLATDDSAIDRFFETMRHGLHHEALKEFSEGARLRLHARSEELLSLIGRGSPELGLFEGKAAIGMVLEAICSVATVIDAKETSREPVGDDGVLVRGNVIQKIAATQKTPEYTFFLLFKLGSDQIDALDISFDTGIVAEGFR
jgi:transcriptional regulator with XRE-family HTH domain